VLKLTLTEPPTAYDRTHWSSRLLAATLAGEGRRFLAVPTTIATLGSRSSAG
jgi:hypothetical protein